MCQYCSEEIKILNNLNTFFPNIIESSTTEDQVYIIKRESGIYELVMCGTDVLSTKIDFCPKCGSHL